MNIGGDSTAIAYLKYFRDRSWASHPFAAQSTLTSVTAVEIRADTFFIFILLTEARLDPLDD
jgi:hypothetical protein